MYCRLSIVDYRLHGIVDCRLSIVDWHSNLKSKIENRKSVADVKGQAVIEYLVVAAALIAAIIAVQGVVQSRSSQVMEQALNNIPIN